MIFVFKNKLNAVSQVCLRYSERGSYEHKGNVS